MSKNVKNTLKKRFIEMVDAVLESRPGIKKAQIAREMGILPSAFSNHLSELRPVPDDFVEKFFIKYGLSIDFYETGNGPIFSKPVNNRHGHENITYKEIINHNDKSNGFNSSQKSAFYETPPVVERIKSEDSLVVLSMSKNQIDMLYKILNFSYENLPSSNASSREVQNMLPKIKEISEILTSKLKRV